MQKVKELYDHNTDTFYLQITEDVEPLLDHLAEQRAHQDPNYYKKSPARWRKIGELPLIIIDQWLREGFNAFENSDEARTELKRRLTGPYKKFMAVDRL